MADVFISGATGYLGKPLAEKLMSQGYTVKALARPQSINRIPAGCIAVPGDALRAVTFDREVPEASTIFHLTGVAHPSPSKAASFHSIDRVSFEASLESALRRKASHFVYVSVAHPAPVMHAYIEVRRACEKVLFASGLRATILRPWYVLGTGHRWPYLLKPLYAVAERVPRWREAAVRLGFVTHRQMIGALLWSAANPPSQTQILNVPDIRRVGPMCSEGAWASTSAL